MKFTDKYENGSVNVWMIVSIIFMIVALALGGLAIWSYINYSDQKTNVDTIKNTAVAEAKKIQADADEVKFTERDKQPNRQFVGPDDYGRVTFDYPKTWSVYINKDVSNGGTYEAYFNPVYVPPVSSTQQFAARLKIEQQDYSSVVSSFDQLVKKGDLKSSSITANGVTGVRLDGNFTKDIRGSEVIFKIRDKTISVRTDANTFLTDFNALITKIKFNS